MDNLYVIINKERVSIDKDVFVNLLDFSVVQELKVYIDTIANHEIRFRDLKLLAQKADVPYPLFFAAKDKVQKQLANKDKRIYSKLPSKDEIKLSSRGRLEVRDIELIAKDLSRRQEFLKTRVLPKSDLNTFVGCVAKMIKAGNTNEAIATEIKSILQLDLNLLRSFPKKKGLEYIRNKAEMQGVFVSFSSHNYMPQNINKEVEFSGICVKDKMFPFVFINTRDGDENPKILEPDGRQIFSLLSMLVCIALNWFVISIKTKDKDEGIHNTVFAIVGELLIPAVDLLNLKLTRLDDVKEYAEYFKVTPSMLLMRLKELKKIDQATFDVFMSTLSEERKKASKHRNAPLQINAYAKYNGERFSKEIIRAYRLGNIEQEEVKSLLFRRGKMSPGLLDEYVKRYS